MTNLGKSERLRLLLFALYIVVVFAAFVYFNLRLNVEWVFLILFVAAFFWGRATQFLIDWSPFLIVLLAWQFTAPLAVNFGFPWHLTELIAADKFVFGGVVPAAWLQQHLYHRNTLEPWDILTVSVYMSHFLTPLVCGFLLWINDRAAYRKFTIAFLVLALGGFVTYVVYPSVAPWMAAYSLVHMPNNTYVQAPGGKVYLPGVLNLFQVNMGHWFSPYHGYVSVTWWGFKVLDLKYNPVAEIPSEHAAFPLLFFLFLHRQFGRAAYIVLAYVGLVLFTILYLGMHWFIDAVIGFSYAIISYALVVHFAPWVRSTMSARVQSIPKFEEATSSYETSQDRHHRGGKYKLRG